MPAKNPSTGTLGLPGTEKKKSRRRHTKLGVNFNCLYDLDRQKAYQLGLMIPVHTKTPTGAPWGYDINAEGTMYLPDDKALKLLLHARKLVEGNRDVMSIREVARWLETVSGRKCNHKTLTHIFCWRYPLDEIALPLKEREQFMYTRSDL